MKKKIRILNFGDCLHDLSICIKNFDKNSSKKGINSDFDSEKKYTLIHSVNEPLVTSPFVNEYSFIL